jgi:hypothetical protein
MKEFQEILPLGKPTRRPTGSSRGARRHVRGGRPHVPRGRAGGAHAARARRHARHRAPAAAGAPRAAAQDPRRPEASANDRFVALELLKNANIAAGGVLPMCQDTGTAIVMGKKGQYVFTGGGDEAALARGVFAPTTRPTCATRSSRRSTCTRRRTPAQPAGADRSLRDRRRRLQVPLHGQGRRLGEQELPLPGDQGAPEPESRCSRSSREAASLGTAACPPYHLAIVIGGTSAEYTLKTAKLASAKYLDTLPTTGNPLGRGFRDLELEQKVLELAQRPASARSSAASTSATTCAWSACRGTALAARSRSP